VPSFSDLSEEEQYKVRWLAGHLLEEGIEGIYFSEVMREDLEKEAEGDIEDEAERQLKGKHF